MSIFDYIDSRNPTANTPSGQVWNFVIGEDIKFATKSCCSPEEWIEQETRILTLSPDRKATYKQWDLALFKHKLLLVTERQEKEDREHKVDQELELCKKRLRDIAQSEADGLDTAAGREQSRLASLAATNLSAPAVSSGTIDQAQREMLEYLREREKELRGMGWSQISTVDGQQIVVEKGAKMTTIEKMTIWTRIMPQHRFLEFTEDKMSFSIEKMQNVLEEKKSRVTGAFFLAPDDEWGPTLLLDEIIKNSCVVDKTIFERICYFEYKFNNLSNVCYPMCYPYGVETFDIANKHHHAQALQQLQLILGIVLGIHWLDCFRALIDRILTGDLVKYTRVHASREEQVFLVYIIHVSLSRFSAEIKLLTEKLPLLLLRTIS